MQQAQFLGVYQPLPPPQGVQGKRASNGCSAGTAYLQVNLLNEVPRQDLYRPKGAIQSKNYKGIFPMISGSSLQVAEAKKLSATGFVEPVQELLVSLQSGESALHTNAVQAGVEAKIKKLSLVDRKSNSKSYVDQPSDAVPSSNIVDIGPSRVASQSTLKQQKQKAEDLMRQESLIWSILEHSGELEKPEQPLSKSHSPVRQPPKGAHLPLVNHFPEFIRLKATLNHQFSIDSFEESPHKKRQPLRKQPLLVQHSKKSVGEDTSPGGLVGSSVNLNPKQPSKRSALRRGMESSQALEKVDEVIKFTDEEHSREDEGGRNKYFKSFVQPAPEAISYPESPIHHNLRRFENSFAPPNPYIN